MTERQGQKDSGLEGRPSPAPANDKVDPVSAGISTKGTIAGRDLSTGGTLDLSNHEAETGGSRSDSQHGGPETGSGGVTGTTGQPESSAHQGPEDQANSTR
jgi:hypothetical protein